jgi:hypothetical protein
MVEDRLNGLALLHIHRQGQSTRQKWGSALANDLAGIYGIMYRHKHFKYGFKVWLKHNPYSDRLIVNRERAGYVDDRRTKVSANGQQNE